MIIFPATKCQKSAIRGQRSVKGNPKVSFRVATTETEPLKSKEKMKEKLRKFATTAAVLSLIICGFTLAVGGPARGAAMVETTFKMDGNVVARTIYSGPGGGHGSNPATYWKLLGRTPMFGRDVVIKPDQNNARMATLKGQIEVSIEIRNSIKMGVAKTTTLKLVRDKQDDPDGWYLPKAELKRLMQLVKPADDRPKKKQPQQTKEE